jgi:hypothetical protein
MAAPYIKKNTLPYDFVTSGVTGISDPDGGSVQDLVSGGTEIATVLNTNNNSLAVSHAGITQTYLPAFQYFYDFAVDGGAVGNIVLRGPKLPANFRITHTIWEPTTLFTSGGSAQISLGTSTAAATNLVGAAVLGTNGTASPKVGVPIWGTIGSSVKVTAESAPVLAVSVAALTAGRGVLTVFGYTSVADSEG